MSIPFIDLKTQYHENKQNIDRAIHRVLDHGQYIMGPEAVSYTHLPSPRDLSTSRMPSSA